MGPCLFYLLLGPKVPRIMDGRLSVSIWWKKEERTEGGKVGREKARKEEQEVGRGRTL